MSNYNDFIFDGKVKETDADGNVSTLLNQNNVLPDDDNTVVVEKSGDDVKISTNLGLKIVNGLLCVTVEEEVE